jgi:uncharacterized protein
MAEPSRVDIKSGYTVSWTNHLSDIPQSAWDALALPLATPFLEWEWLHNLETSGSATPRAGWLPNHLSVWRDRQLVAAAPLYIKGHSYGEFVFDHQWAEVAYRMGINYYPKLLGMTPFTPAAGYRFLIAEGENELDLTALMVAEIDHFCDRNRLSGCNFLFVDPDWQPLMEQLGYTPWLHHSYVWQNNDFGNFADYLNYFNANQRRNIKRERKAVEQSGLTIKTLVSEEIPRAYYSQIYHFYSDTCDKFWGGSKYLTQKFFEQLHSTYAQRLMLVTAHRDGSADPMAMSFCLHKGDRLYGRYWGCDQEIDCLHFEACYYAPIEWAIQHGVQIFDPGAGGRHKKRRGFPATPNYSLHRFYAPRLNQILQGYIDEINQHEQAEIDQLNADLPFPLPQNYSAD